MGHEPPSAEPFTPSPPSVNVQSVIDKSHAVPWKKPPMPRVSVNVQSENSAEPLEETVFE
jgi:hypothetical protein